jgi:hypothetical protein
MGSEGLMSDALQQASSAFLEKLTEAIKFHGRRRRFDAGLHQSLVIGAAIAGFASLSLGLAAHDHPDNAIWAGAIGALTSVATILSQQLHCVKAVNWHDRKAVELDIIRDKFLYKYKSAPSDQELAELSEEVANLTLRMAEAWEKVTNSGPTMLGKIKKTPKAQTA